MRIFIYHSTVKHTTSHGKYKTLKGALKQATKFKDYYKETDCNWMHVWIGQD